MTVGLAHSGEAYDAARRTILAIFFGAFAALVLNRALATALPFRVRPMFVPGIGYRPPSIDLPMNLEEWKLAMQKVRTPLGTVQQRTVFNTEFDNSFPGAPTGVYAHVEFRTAFARKSGGETVSLEREADGNWHVIGYSIHD